MNIKTFTDAPRSDKARAFAKDVQDKFAYCGSIVGVKYIFTPVRGKFHLYIWNEYMDIGIYYQDFDNSSHTMNIIIWNEITDRKKINMDKCNYYQWAKLMHTDRPDWQEKYPEWMQKYRMYKVEKLFEK